MNSEELRINEEARAKRARIKKPAQNGITVVDQTLCKGCGICIRACPTGVLLFRETVMSKWGVEVVAESPEHCTGCRRCEIHCPDFAIFAYRNDELKEGSENGEG